MFSIDLHLDDLRSQRPLRPGSALPRGSVGGFSVFQKHETPIARTVSCLMGVALPPFPLRQLSDPLKALGQISGKAGRAFDLRRGQAARPDRVSYPQFQRIQRAPFGQHVKRSLDTVCIGLVREAR